MQARVFPILLVEDSVDDQVLIRRAFTRAKLLNPLHIVDDGDKAIAYLAGEPPYDNREANPLPAIILLDLKLPRRSGHEVLKWIRGRNGELARIPVVILTSSNEKADISRAYDLGANSYLVKPVDFEGLLQMVGNIGVYWLVHNENPMH